MDIKEQNRTIDLDSLDREKLKYELESQGYTLVDPVIPEELLSDIRNFWIGEFGKHVKREEVVWTPYLGEANKTCFSHDSFQRFYRSYDFMWNPAYHAATRDLCLDLHAFRNGIIGVDQSVGLTYDDKRYGIYITASYYPPDQGYMGGHSDKTGAYPLVHFIVPITFKGPHYEGGGLYLTDRKGRTVDVESVIKPGGFLLYHGELNHGVERIVGRTGSNIGRLQIFTIPTNFMLPLECNRVQEQVGVLDPIIARARKMKRDIRQRIRGRQ